MKKILMLGSNSCAGSGVIAELAKTGDYDILPTSRSEELGAFFLPYKWLCSQHIRPFEILDLNLHLEKLQEIVVNFKPDYIINFASQSMVAESWDTPEDWMQTNVSSFMKLVKILQSTNCLKKYIHFSTPEVYGDTGNARVKENTDFKPTTPYALSRACGDQIVKMWHTNFGFPVIITRSANVYGPGQQFYRIIPKTIFSILKGKKVPLHGDGLSIRSFIHYTDIAKALDILLKFGKIGESYHISPPKFISIADLVHLIATEMRVDFNKIILKSPDRRGKDQHYLLDSEKINKIGWEPQIKLREGISDCIDWVKHNLDMMQDFHLEYTHKK